MVTRVLAFAFALLFAAPVMAQDDEAAARAAFEEGQAHAADERWAEALEDFERSYELFERPTTLYNIASVLVRLGRARAAIDAIDRFLEQTERRPNARIVRDARALREAAAESLRTLELTVDPPGATVRVDGAERPGDGATRQIVLDPGGHEVEVSAPGYAPERRELDRDATRLEVRLGLRPGELELRADVEGAALRVDGEAVGTTHASLTLPAGPYRVEATAEGYEAFARDVELPPGERVQVIAQLVPIPSEPGVFESPLFWGISGGVLALGVVALVVGLTVQGPVADPYGGSAEVVIQPLLRF